MIKKAVFLTEEDAEFLEYALFDLCFSHNDEDRQLANRIASKLSSEDEIEIVASIKEGEECLSVDLGDVGWNGPGMLLFVPGLTFEQRKEEGNK